jgi:hypothetical protein
MCPVKAPMSRWSLFFVAVGCLCLVSVGFAPGCGGKKGDNGFGNPGDDGGGGSSGGSGGGGSNGGSGCGLTGCGDGSEVEPTGDGGCTNLQCDVHSCSGSTNGTQITGTVLDPAGRNPLYNVVVYVPNSQGGKLQPIPIGVNSTSCSCDALFSGDPITYALTDTSGNFTLNNVPDGAQIPLVVQIGKWRKEITLPSVTQCTSNSAGKINLPKNLSDGAYASIPNIAVSTGGADTLECLLTRVGVDEAFFTGSTTGPGVHIFQGYGGNAASGSQAPAQALWDSQADLMQYDIIMLSCEGTPTVNVTATTASYLGPYVSAGGRVFAEHYHYAFFTSYATTSGTAYPQFQNVANWTNLGLGGNDSPYGNDISGVIETTLPNGKMFPEGAALKSWLGNVGALTNGEIVVPAANARDTATVTAANVSTPWVQTDPTVSPASSQYFSWDMPFNPPVTDAGVPEYCGRVVYSDMHVSGSAADYQGTSTVVPTGCDSTSPLSADEDAIEFILFDLSSCITPVGYTPQAPEGGILQ